MRNLKYVFLLAVSLTFFVGCSKQAPIPGATGPTGATGVAGGNLIHAQWLVNLSSMSLVGSGTLYHQSIWYPYYNKNLSYMVSGYVTKVPTIDTLKFPTWYKLPYVNVYTTTGDQLYCTLGNDTIKIWYYNPGASNFPLDSNIMCKIIIIPQQ